MGGIGKFGAGVAAIVTGALAGCTTPGAPVSPDPLRFVLDGEPGPCRIVFGPLAPNPLFQLDEVGQIDAPAGVTYLSRGIVSGDRAEPSLQVGGIQVHVAALDGEVEVAWSLPPTTVGFSTRALDEAAVRAILPELVSTADMASLARLLADHLDGADVVYAGRAPEYDVGLVHDDGLLLFAGRGVTPERLDAYYGGLGADHDGDQWRTDALLAVDSVAAGATVVLGGGRAPVESEVDGLLAVLRSLLGDAAPAVGISDGARAAAPSSCGALHPGVPVDASITDVAIAESDVGDVLRITFDGLPPDEADPQLLHVVVGGVLLVAPYQGGPTVDFPAALTHAESRLLRDRLTG